MATDDTTPGIGYGAPVEFSNPTQAEVQGPEYSVPHNVDAIQPPRSQASKLYVSNAFEAGFKMIGSGLAQMTGDPGLAAGFAQIGAGTSAALHARWWKNEADYFDENIMRPSMKRMEMAQAAFDEATKVSTLPGDEGQEIRVIMGPGNDPIPIESPNAVAALQAATQTAFDGVNKEVLKILDAAANYPDNPIISQKAANIVAYYTEQSKAATGFRQEQRAEEELTLQRASTMADIGYKREMAAAQRASAGARGAGSKKQEGLFFGLPKDVPYGEAARFAIGPGLQSGQFPTLGKMFNQAFAGAYRRVMGPDMPVPTEELSQTPEAYNNDPKKQQEVQLMATNDYLTGAVSMIKGGTQWEADIKLSEDPYAQQFTLTNILSEEYGIPLPTARGMMQEFEGDIPSIQKEAVKRGYITQQQLLKSSRASTPEGDTKESLLQRLDTAIAEMERAKLTATSQKELKEIDKALRDLINQRTKLSGPTAAERLLSAAKRAITKSEKVSAARSREAREEATTLLQGF